MSALPELTEADVRNWTSDAYFRRGEGYFHNGHIVDPRLQGNTLKARCLGSRPTPYRLEVTLNQEGIAHGECSCPIGSGGHCKHAIALLLTWVYERDTFLEVEELETALERRSKDELITLIQLMLTRHPDLESLLELPIVGEAGADRPLDPEVVRRQASNAFHGIEYDTWPGCYAVSQQLLGLVGIADAYAERGRWHDAATVYELVMREVLDSYSMVRDEEGDLHAVVDECVERLGDCLAMTEDSAQRETILRALFDVYRWDVAYGGIDMGYQAPGIILEQATPEERAQVAQWVRDVLPTGDSWSNDYHRRRFGGLLLDLEEEWLDDEAFLRICRETNRWRDLVDRLLTLGRVEEAAAVARDVSSFELLHLADIFVSHGHADLAEDLVRQRAQVEDEDNASRRDRRLIEWLKDRAQEGGDPEKALALAERLFWEHPSLSGYQEMERAARALQRWDELRVATLNRLADKKKYQLLIRIHLEEGAIDRALETLEEISRSQQPMWGVGRLRIKVARAAEESRPWEAIHLYMETVERLIDARGRGNYADAAQHLIRVREIYHQMGESEAWKTLIANVREQNRRLPALQDELNKAGL